MRAPDVVHRVHVVKGSKHAAEYDLALFDEHVFGHFAERRVEDLIGPRFVACHQYE